jgi:hypothetical protein
VNEHEWSFPVLLFVVGMIAVTVVGTLEARRSPLSPEALAEQVEGSSCLLQAIMRNERAGNPFRPWNKVDISDAQADCDKQRLLEAQTKGILAAQTRPAEKR